MSIFSVELKPIESWAEADILALPVGEFDWLDFKRSAWLHKPDFQNDLSKYVSAWANYSGGYLVVGYEDPVAGGVLQCDGGVDPRTSRKLMDQLDATIPHLVDPPLRTFKTHAIPVTPSSSGNVAIAIHISESSSAPHQARDGKFYTRRGRNLSHLRAREIDDIRGRVVHPTIRTELSCVRTAKYPDGSITWRIFNTSNVFARYIKAVIKFPTELKGKNLFVKDATFDSNDERSWWELRTTNSMGAPLFPQSDMSRMFEVSWGVRFEPPMGPSIRFAEVVTYADGMPPFTETFPIENIPVY